MDARAKAMRTEMTPQEKVVWRILHDGELAALNWRRQIVFGNYILDFVSHPARLVVEVDGCQHSEPKQAAHDVARTEWLESQGYRVLRFWNPEAMREHDGVWRTVQDAALKTPARQRMLRWREAHMEAVRTQNARVAEQSARLPVDGGGAAEGGGGGARSVMKEEPPEAHSSTPRASPPQSALRADSSPIEGERGAVSGEGG